MRSIISSVTVIAVFFGISTIPPTNASPESLLRGATVENSDRLVTDNTAPKLSNMIVKKKAGNQVNLSIDVSFETKTRVAWETATNTVILEDAIISACNEAYPEEMLHLSKVVVSKVTEGPSEKKNSDHITKANEKQDSWWWNAVSVTVEATCPNCDPASDTSTFVLKGPYHKMFEDYLFRRMVFNRAINVEDEEYSVARDLQVSIKYIGANAADAAKNSSKAIIVSMGV